MKQKIQKKQKKTITIIISASFFFILLFLPLLIFSHSQGYYHSQIEKNNVPDTVKGESSEKLADNILNYLKSGQELSSAFTLNEKSHMKDVKIIFDTIKIIIFISVLIIITTILSKQTTELRKGLRNGATAILVFLLILILLVLINFQFSFEIMHEIFFPQGNWTFPEGSALITILPENFFYNTATYSFTASLSVSLLILLIFILIKKLKKKTEPDQKLKKQKKTKKTMNRK